MSADLLQASPKRDFYIFIGREHTFGATSQGRSVSQKRFFILAECNKPLEFEVLFVDLAQFANLGCDIEPKFCFRV